MTKFGRRPAFLQRLDEALEHVRPVVLGAGDVTLRRERLLVESVTAGLDAAPLRRLDDNRRSVEVTGNDVAASVDERIRRRGVVRLVLPLAGEDDPHGRVGIGLAAAETKRIHVEEHRTERLAGDEAERVSGRAEPGGDAVHIVALVDQPALAADIRRVASDWRMPRPGGTRPSDISAPAPTGRDPRRTRSK